MQTPHIALVLVGVCPGPSGPVRSAQARVVASNIADLIAGREPSTTYTPGTERIILPLGPDGGASQVLRDGVRVVVGPEETARMKGEDLLLGYIAKALGVKS